MATDVGLPEGFVLDSQSDNSQLPEGFVLDSQPSTDNSLASGYAQLATQQKEGLDRSAEQGAGLGAAMRDAVTGESRMTPEMERLQNVGSAPELNSLSNRRAACWMGSTIWLRRFTGEDPTKHGRENQTG